MDTLSAQNPRSRSHQEQAMGPDGMGYSTWSCIPIRDVVPFRNRLLDGAGQLDAAWAEAEAALPEGWRISNLLGWSEWVAQAEPKPAYKGNGRSSTWLGRGARGPTPAAALLALAAELRNVR